MINHHQNLKFHRYANIKHNKEGENKMTLDNIKEEILSASNIVILTHENPDGDAIRKFSCTL